VIERDLYVQIPNDSAMVCRRCGMVIPAGMELHDGETGEVTTAAEVHERWHVMWRRVLTRVFGVLNG